MKKTIRIVTLSLLLCLSAVSCKKKFSDADLTTKATEITAAYVGTNVVIKEGKAELTGEFKDLASKNAAIAALKKVEGVKEVSDLSTIAPLVVKEVVKVVSAVAPEIVTKVNDALKDFPSVKAEVINNVLTLTGNATSLQARKIKMSIDALKIGKYENKLVVK